MSIDLEGWFIKTNKNTNFNRAKHKLDVIGANHDWNYSASGYRDEEGNFVATIVYRDGTGPQWWNADETHSFMEQVQLVIENCSSWAAQESIDYFLLQAKEFEALSKQLNKPIRSYWI